MLLTIVFPVLALYFLFCIRYAMFDALGERVKASVFYKNNVLWYSYDDDKGNRYSARGNSYLPTVAKEGGEVEVAYLPFKPGMHILTDWLAMRFKQMMILGICIAVTGAASYGLIQYWPQVEQEWAKRNDPNNHFLNPIQGPIGRTPQELGIAKEPPKWEGKKFDTHMLNPGFR